jgi:hypothetical protein
MIVKARLFLFYKKKKKVTNNTAFVSVSKPGLILLVEKLVYARFESSFVLFCFFERSTFNLL